MNTLPMSAARPFYPTRAMAAGAGARRLGRERMVPADFKGRSKGQWLRGWDDQDANT